MAKLGHLVGALVAKWSVSSVYYYEKPSQEWCLLGVQVTVRSGLLSGHLLNSRWERMKRVKELRAQR